jgi:trimethylamine--corrinoid protein Co-methyltransferase
MTVLNKHDIDEIHAAALRILEETGFGTNCADMRELAKSAGFEEENGAIHIKPGAVEKALAEVPRSFRLCNPSGECIAELGAGDPLFFSGHQAVFVHDYGAEETRPGCCEDVVRFTQVANALDDIDGIATPVYPQEVPTHAALVHAVAEMLQHMTKPIFFAPEWRDDFETICSIARIASGMKNLHEQPFLIAQPSPISPLYWIEGSAQCILSAAKEGIPCVSLTQIIPGMSGPVTLAGTLALHHAEFLIALVVMQLVNPGTPVIYPGAWVTFDMAGGGIDIGAPEKYLLSISSAQLADFVGVPCMAAGPDTNAHYLDVQNGIEKAFSGIADAFAGTDMLVNSGMYSNALTVSLEQLVLDADIASMIRRMMHGVDVSENTISFETINRVGIKGEYLSDYHTARHFREELWDTGKSILQRDKVDKWKASGSKKVETRAHERVERILEDSPPPRVDQTGLLKIQKLMAAFDSSKQ